MPDTENRLLQKLLSEIEEALKWEAPAAWGNYDFEKLSDIIFEKTATRLSVTTLKRIWGKVKYHSAPNISTLNALSKFVGYEDWRTFKQTHHHVFAEPATGQAPSNTEQRTKARGYARYGYWVLGALVPVLLITVLMSNKVFRKVIINPDDYQFEANKMVTTGVPNSVIFTYDASKAPTDSIYIVQTWDIRRKTLVSKEGKHHSAIYYYPGFFRSKLIVDSIIVRTHDILIGTDGWLGILEADYGQKPVYFNKKEITRDSEIVISDDLLKPYAGHIESGRRVRLFNQRDLDSLQSDAFEFETKVKLDYADPCHFMQVLIQLKDDVISISLCEPACVGDISVYAMGTGLQAKTADLSGFGANLNEWATLHVKGEGNQLSMYVNGKQAVMLTTTNPTTGIVGLQYRVQGPARVKETWFKDIRRERVVAF